MAITSDLPLLARAITEKFARIENPDDPQLDAYGDLQALIEAGLLATLQDQQAQIVALTRERDVARTQHAAEYELAEKTAASLLALTTQLEEAKRQENGCRAKAVSLIQEKLALEADVADLRRQLQTYGSCTLECARRRCIHCDKRDWMHDLTEDLDEMTCLFQGLTFTPKHCDCGFTAALRGETEK